MFTRGKRNVVLAGLSTFFQDRSFTMMAVWILISLTLEYLQVKACVMVVGVNILKKRVKVADLARVHW